MTFESAGMMKCEEVYAMRICAGQGTGLFQVGEMNPAMNQRHVNRMSKLTAGRRSDEAVISPLGKSSNLLVNLMNQKELIQMNKESLIKRSLDEENGTVSCGLKEQLEEYEEQLEEIDQQIAAEMAKQAENDNTYQKPQNSSALEPADKSTAGLTKLSAELDKAQTAEQVHIRREGEKKVCESEIETGGSEAAKYKLDKMKEIEWLTDKLKPVLGNI